MKKPYKNRVNVFRVFTVFVLIEKYISVYIWPVGITFFDTGASQLILSVIELKKFN